MKNPNELATIKQGPGRGTHALTVELGDDLTLYFSYAEPVAVSYRGQDGRFNLAVRECSGACATKTTAAHCAAIEREGLGRSTHATHAENLRARLNPDAFAQLLAEVLPTAATFPGITKGRSETTLAHVEEAVRGARQRVKLRRALRLLESCPGIDQTEQGTGQTFRAIIAAALEV